MRGTKRLVGMMCAVLGTALLLGGLAVGGSPKYVGTESCAACHGDQAQLFRQHSKKANSSRSLKIMASDLTEEELKSCFGCHTTGYGQPGGFTDFARTPQMADLGCESCHGPGGDHVESGGNPLLIKRKLSREDCATCHNQERIRSFNFKPLLFGGAH